MGEEISGFEKIVMKKNWHKKGWVGPRQILQTDKSVILAKWIEIFITAYARTSCWAGKILNYKCIIFTIGALTCLGSSQGTFFG